MVQPIRPVWLKEKQWSCGPDSELKDLGVVFLCLSKRKPPCCLACISHSQLSLSNNYKTLIITALFISNILHLTVCITALQLDSITPEVMLLYWISSLVWSCHRPRAEDRHTPDDIQHNNVTSSVMLLQYNSSTKDFHKSTALTAGFTPKIWHCGKNTVVPIHPQSGTQTPLWASKLATTIAAEAEVEVSRRQCHAAACLPIWSDAVPTDNTSLLF